DPETEFALAVIAIAQEVILTSVTTTGASSPNSNGKAGVGNVSDPTQPSTIAAQNAQAAGLNVDSHGNVSFPNGVATGGNYSLSSITAPSFGQTSSSIFGNF